MKFCPWLELPIHECGEPLVEIPPSLHRISPHPYQQLGAPYGSLSPHVLRASVADKLLAAARQLEALKPGWRISVFDAYRPRAVQQFMVDHCYKDIRAADPAADDEQIWRQVYTFWAIPSDDPATPPAHSTGAALDISLLDEHDQPLNMGTEIDDFTDKARPDYFAGASNPVAQSIHANRELLRQLMQQQGFHQHPAEWWHFSFGDQIWAWRERQHGKVSAIAQYACVEDLANAQPQTNQ